MDYLEEQKRKIHPKEKANIFSVLSFFYTLKLFRKGYKKDLEEDDLYRVVSDFRSKDLGNQLEDEWAKQKIKRKRLSIFRLLFACYGKGYLLAGLIQFLIKSIIILFQPQALGKLVSYFSPGQTAMTRKDAYFYGILVIGINLINCVVAHNYYFYTTALGIKVRTAFSTFIYRKALKLSPTRLGDISIGKIVTLITKDVHSLETFLNHANDIWIGFLKTIVISFIIYQKIGITILSSVGFFLLILPLQIYLGSLATSLRMKMCKQTDKRLQITQEALSAIKIIKIYTWEHFFDKQVSHARQKEISKMHKIFMLKFAVLVIGILNSKIAFYLLIMTYLWLGNNITAEIVFFILSCFQILTHTLSILVPLGISDIAEVFASVKRLGNVLKAMEIQITPQDTQITIKPKIILNNVTVNLKDKEILHNIDLNVDLGVTLITGPVGSGKSFLLKTILQDYQPIKGSLVTHGRISYASQEPWLFPSSIKQNILFGEFLNETRYQEVLKVCALKFDFDLLAHGDNTIVEDRGINLSKGQQARINLARAVYKDSDIYLLDDCLSALDAHVSAYIFTECIMKFLKNKLVILVTHNTNHIKDVDNFVIMANGTIKSTVKPIEINEKDIIKEVEETLNCNEEEEEEADEETKLITETTNERKVYQEIKQTGEVDFRVYKKYIKFGGGFFALFLVFLVFVASQFVISFSDKLVSNWVNLEQELSNFTITNNTDLPEFYEKSEQRTNMLILYSIMIIAMTILSFSRSLVLYYFARKASINLHKYMITNVVNATMQFFDTNFIGNILNRFSKDLGTIDEKIPSVFYHVFRVLLILVGIIVLIATVNVYFLIPTLIFFLILVIIRRGYLPTGRSLKRLDATTRSPVIGHLNATLEGLTTIRAFKAQNILRDEFDRHQDLYTSANYIFYSSMRAFAFCLDTLCTFYIALIVAKFLIFDNDTLAGNVGLAISQAFLMTGTLQWGIRQWAEIENQMTSVERVLEYTEVKQENKSGLFLDNWPNQGKVAYENVFLTYTNSSEYVLKNINFTIESKQKIGIVGRTGAGKSSIISTLFRLYEVEGRILIDNVDIKTLSLEFLRSKISIIPQDPVLFSGTVRDNIDPLGKYSDQEIWNAITIANLKKLVPNLDFEISENGSNFSVGQRQLICLARAVVRNNRIIVLDEATANMDPETDELIHNTIRRNFKNCTVFTIAHKLHSVLHSDKVIVMDKGEIIEFDHPNKLLENKEGIFYKMVQKSGLLQQQN